jgi:hypothetical protein
MGKARVKIIYKDEVIFPAIVSIGYFLWVAALYVYVFTCTEKFCSFVIVSVMPDMGLFGFIGNFQLAAILIGVLNTVAVFYLNVFVLWLSNRKKKNN